MHRSINVKPGRGGGGRADVQYLTFWKVFSNFLTIGTTISVEIDQIFPPKMSALEILL